MSEMYEEPEDPGHEPNRDPIKIAVETEITFGEVLDRIAWRALDSFRRDYAGGDGGQRNLDNVIERRIAKAVDAKAKALVEERVEAVVSKLLAEGWQEPKSYNSAPKHVTLESFVLSMLTKVHTEDRHQGLVSGTLVERTIVKCVNSELAKLLAAELEEAKKRFRASVDALIEAKVLEAARAALLGSR